MQTPGARADPWTVRRLLAWTRDYLARHGVESPRLCAELLLAHALGCERIQLYARYDSVPGAAALAAFRAAVRQAATGRPIAYLTGTKEFFSLTFEVTPDVLIPRPETETLVERTIELVRAAPDRLGAILDLGTGSGCIAISLAKHLPGARLFASDISQAALQVARRNAARHGVSERVEFRAGDLFEPWSQTPGPPPRFDVIVCNPPYIAQAQADELAPAVREHEPPVALFAGPDGLSLLQRVIRESPRWLVPGGHLLLEVACGQAPAVRRLLDESAWDAIVTYQDALQHQRVVHARRGQTGPPS